MDLGEYPRLSRWEISELLKNVDCLRTIYVSVGYVRRAVPLGTVEVSLVCSGPETAAEWPSAELFLRCRPPEEPWMHVQVIQP